MGAPFLHLSCQGAVRAPAPRYLHQCQWDREHSKIVCRGQILKNTWHWSSAQSKPRSRVDLGELSSFHNNC